MSWIYFAITISCFITLACSEPCSPPDVPADGSYHPKQDKYFPGDKIVYTCNEGFGIYGNEVSTCSVNGDWSNQMPFCDQLVRLKIREENPFEFNPRRVIDKNISTCFLLNQDKKNTLILEFNVVQVYAVKIFLEKGTANLKISSALRGDPYDCSNFHKTIGRSQWASIECRLRFYVNTIKIENTGRGNISICEIQVYGYEYSNRERTCDHPPDVRIPNGFFEVSRKEAILHCEDGFTAVSSKKIPCVSNVWMNLWPRCDETLCQLYENNRNSEPGTEWIILDSVQKLTPGTTRKLKCSPGYKKVGEPEETTCQKNGTWTKTSATCVLDQSKDQVGQVIKGKLKDQVGQVIKVAISAKTEKTLLHHLFEEREYDKLFRPVKHHKTIVPVTVSLTPLEMKYKIYQNSPWKLDTWLAVKWKDEFLTWNPKEFDNIEKLILPVSKVWRPDLSLYHNNLDSSFLSNTTTNVIVRFDGELTWVTLNSIHIDFDEKLNNCTISIKARTYDVSLMKVNAESQQSKSLSHFKNNSWKLQSIEVSEELGNFSWSEQPFNIVHFNLKFRKHQKEATPL